MKISDHKRSKAADEVIQQVLTALKEANPAAFDIFEFEYERALRMADKKGLLRVCARKD